MRKAPWPHLSIAAAFLFPILAIAQTPVPSDQTQEQSSGARAVNSQTTDWRITEKEVKAVQAELIVRGYYKSKVTGVLDRDTRDAVLAYQSDNGLKASGRIDMETYNKLELVYPATGKEADRLRGDDMTAKVGYGVKDTTLNTGASITGGAKKIGSGVRGGLEKTWDTVASTPSKSKEAMHGAGDATVRGMKGAGRAGVRLIGRSDTEVQEEVRRTLEDNPETRDWYSEVKNGTVTIKTPPDHKADVGAVVSNIRKVPGVKSIFVIAL